jgi:hypothetical protein
MTIAIGGAMTKFENQVVQRLRGEQSLVYN